MSAKKAPASQMASNNVSGTSLRSKRTRAATQVTSRMSIRPSCGEGSMRAIELVSTVTNKTMFRRRCGSAAAASSAWPA